jgi:hypothetical protein
MFKKQLRLGLIWLHYNVITAAANYSSCVCKTQRTNNQLGATNWALHVGYMSKRSVVN